jgi:hypothetical protein
MVAPQDTQYHNPDQETKDNPQWWTRPPDYWTPEELQIQRAAREAIEALDALELERRLVRRVGPCGLVFMVRQLVYWFSKPKMLSRWWLYKTVESPKDGTSKGWHEELGLNRNQVRKANKAGEALGIFRVAHGPGRKPYYCVDWVRLAEELEMPFETAGERPESDFDEIQSGTPRGVTLDRYPLGGHSREVHLGGSLSKQESNANEKKHEISPTGGRLAPLAPPTEGDISKKDGSTSTPPHQPDDVCESATEKGTSNAPPLAREDESSMSRWIREAREQMAETPRPRDTKEQGVVEGETTADVFVAYLARELDGAGVVLTDEDKGRYGKEFSTYLRNGVAPDVLYKVADRIIERWPEVRLRVEHAYRDVARAGGTTKRPAREKRDPEKEAQREREYREAQEAFHKTVEEMGMSVYRSYNGY